MPTRTRSILALLLCSLFLSCDQSLVYKQAHENETGIWAAQAFPFDFEIADTLASYDLVLEVKHDETFYYQNLYAKFETHYPSGKNNSDIVSLELASKVGQWHGDCSGERCETPILLQKNIHFKELGMHQIRISQNSRKAELEGIYKLELQLRKASQS